MTDISTVSALHLPIVYTMQRTRNVVLPGGTRVVTSTIMAGSEHHVRSRPYH